MEIMQIFTRFFTRHYAKPIPRRGTHYTSFLDLPAEIRNRVYTLLLPQGRKYNLRYPRFGMLSMNDIAICHTSRQLRDESMPMFWCRNTSEFYGFHSEDLLLSRCFFRLWGGGLQYVRIFSWRQEVQLPTELIELSNYNLSSREQVSIRTRLMVPDEKSAKFTMREAKSVITLDVVDGDCGISIAHPAEWVGSNVVGAIWHEEGFQDTTELAAERMLAITEQVLGRSLSVAMNRNKS